MIVGIDFDNTIVCYDGLFHQAAVARGMIPDQTPPAKEAVRDFLRAAGREQEWTELQGLVYGQEIHRAKPFAGVGAFLQRCRQEQVTVTIISHRTRQPFAGPAIDMHEAAHAWLDARQWFNDSAPGPDRTHGLDRSRVFFEETKAGKLARIADADCDVFVDDLAELLVEHDFPGGVERVLFDPHATAPRDSPLKRVGSWDELAELIFARSRP